MAISARVHLRGRFKGTHRKKKKEKILEGNWENFNIRSKLYKIYI